MAERTVQTQHIIWLLGLLAQIVTGDLVINVREDVEVGSTLSQSFPSPPSGFIYKVFGGGDREASSLFRVSSDGKISVKTKLNYMIGKRNSFRLIAVKRKADADFGGTAEVATINVIDTNNHVPAFKKSAYQGQIYENSPAGSVVLGLEDCFATDEDSSGIAKYVIISGNSDNLFLAKVKDISGLKLLQIVTTGNIDREALGNTPYVNLQVQAVDGGNPAKQSLVVSIRIQVLDKNDYSPVFDQVNWRATIQEDSQVMTSVLKVGAKDKDEGSNKQLYYYFEESQDDFVIDPYTGVVYVAAPLLYNRKSSYEIKVIVTDRGVQNSQRSSSTVHIVLVKVPGYPTASVQNTAPQFASSSYEIKVRGNLPVKAFVLLPRAKDNDGIGNNNGQLKFSFGQVSSSSGNPFAINPKSGAITVSQQLPATKQSIELKVTAEDGGTLKATTTVKIEILPVNQNKGPPEFKESTVNVDVNEDATPASQVFKAEATDSDNVKYSIISGTGLGRFQINENTGVVTPKITFKSLTAYDLYIEAKDQNNFKMSSFMYARINVRSSNASYPVFTKAMYIAYIDEGETAGSFVTAVFAEFADPSKVVRYKAVNSANGVQLDQKTGIVTTNRLINFEDDKKITLEVNATIEGLVKESKTLIEVFIRNKNDLKPDFPKESINLKVPENLGYIPNLVCLFAMDGDGSSQLSYSIKGGNVGGVFQIDSKTGQLSVKNLDYETRTTYNLVVEATDGLNTATARVNVDVINDARSPEPPHFGTYNDVFIVNEGSSSTSVQLPVVGAASSFNCEFGFDVTPDILDKFLLKSQSTGCLIETTGGIKWTKDAPSYKFTIRVISKTNAMLYSSGLLTVKINDANDHVPKFSQESYAASVMSNAAVGTSVLKVTAVDDDSGDNGAVSYSFLRGVDSESFNLDAVNGVIKIQKALQSGKEYKMTVRASDRGATPKYKDVLVKVGVHDTNMVLPKFINLPSTVSPIEGISGGTVLKIKAEVKDGNAEYDIVGGNMDNQFAIANDGTIYVNQKLLDREKVSDYKLVVRATKQSSSPVLAVEETITVTVKDVNDHVPEFNVRTSPEVTIQKNAPVGTVVSMYRAYDKDYGVNGVISYDVLPGAGETNIPFTADNATGIITTTQIITTKRSYNIILKATNKQASDKKSKQLNIKVNVVDGGQVPAFQDSFFKVTLQDNNKVGAVGDVSVKNDQNINFIHYEIIAGNQENRFCIDYTRNIYLQKPLDLDELKEPLKDMTVSMKVRNSMSSAPVYIRVKKQNDNVPVFVGGTANVEVELPEDTAKGKFIYQFSASDLDDPKTGVEYSIFSYGSIYSKDKFEIDSVNGKVTLKDSLDFEQLDKHVITIKAKERSGTAYALKNLIVKVTDVNDEAPVFSVKSSRYYIPKDADVGAKVLQAFASDLDSGSNGEITYKLTNNKDEIFKIDPNTGVVTLNKIIANYDTDTFTIVLMATDKGNPSKTGQAAVTIEAVTNDGPPKFALNTFRFEFNEGDRMHGKTKAISVDTLTYSILSGNIGNRFKIDKAKGFITSVNPLDAEEGMEYTLVVEAKDTSERSATAQVHITVKNLNDNEPTFKNAKDGLIEKVVSDQVTAGETLVTVEGEDKDVDDRLTYEIVDRAQKNNFEINPNTGEIKLKKDWASIGATNNIAEFDVKASDRGSPTKSKTVRVRFVFANFKPDHVKIVKPVREDASVSLSAVISDLPRVFPQGGYQIMFPKKHPFKISEKTGEISLTEGLDFEKVQSYDIVIQENNYNKQEKIRYLNYKLEVKVVDVNDNAPIFQMDSLEAEVNKNARPGTPVIKLNAKDADSGDAGRVSFDIMTDNVPFTVNPVTQYIEMSKQGPFDKNQYEIQVAAVDSGLPQRQSAKKPIIKINIVNKPPQFAETLYKFSVSENANVGTVVGTVKAKSLSGIKVSYEIDSGNVGDKFMVDKDGRVSVQLPLDFETDPNSFALVISAKEMDSKMLKSSTNVIIEVKNDNDHAPKFTEIVYKATDISENIALNSLILKVTATDKDCGRSGICIPGSLIYSTDQFKDTFRLDSLTGEIRNIKPLDYDTKEKYEFEVKVEDTGLKKRTAKAKVIISLKGVNDNPPVFHPSRQTLYVAEDTTPNSIVTVVSATDADNDPLTYSFKGGSTSPFSIDSKTGIVKFVSNRLTLNDYRYNITASDGKFMGFFDLIIKIDDKNNNPPEFTKCPSNPVVIAENLLDKRTITTVAATDKDFGRNGEIEYTLIEVRGRSGSSASGSSVGGTGSSRTVNFIINQNGEIKPLGAFDRERQDSYTLIAIARDGGANRTDFERNSAACEVNIKIGDKNDEVPIFAVSSYEVSVWEKTPVGSTVLLPSAIDKDIGSNAEIEYILDTETTLFAIPDRKKAELTVRSDLTGNIGNHNLKVRARNTLKSETGLEFSSTITVKLTIGKSKPPKFSSASYTTNIKESMKAPDVIQSLDIKAVSESGLSNAKIVYNKIQGTFEETNIDTFNFDSQTGKMSIAGELNYERIKRYVVYVQAKDESNDMVSNAVIYVNIEDVNDNAPTFYLSKYEFHTVTEGSSAITDIGRIFAYDRDSTTNAEISFNIQDAAQKLNFSIDSTTGLLRTKRTFDREERESYTIHVDAKDKPGYSANVFVTIKIVDINDNPPVLVPSVYNGEVKEDARIGYQILTITAKDKDKGDNAKVQFYITGGNEGGYFATSASTFKAGTSTASIIVAKPLDREKKDTFRLSITATDSRFIATGVVNIKVKDANDNPPVFLKDFYLGEIKENAKAGVFVTTVKATDADTGDVQGPIRYSLSKEVEGYFVIDPVTGVITTGPKSFDRESKEVYRFTVIASDGALKGTAIVQCTIKDVNDKSPFFPGAPFTLYVEEHKPIGTKVGYVPAKDLDDPNAGGNAKITYSIVGPDNGFEINPNTGLVTTKKEFNREAEDHAPVYKITVRATDAGVPVLSNETVVTIVITDSNDNDPKFTKALFTGKVAECAPGGTPITAVTAVDKDDSKTVNAQLMYYVISSSHNSDKYFHIDSRTGVITVAHGLDYERSSTYTLKIGVKDRGIPQRPVGREESTKVNIEVSDCNDNRPTFVPDTYTVRVPENVKAGSTILTVTAVDKDKGSNGEFTFGIVDTETNFQFSISSSSQNKSKGIIKLLYPVDREAIPHHVFKISASDLGIPKQTGYASVNVSLVDINDNGPHFDKPDYCGRVDEEVTGVQVVKKIRVKDPDTSKYSCPCTFKFDSGETSLFEMRNADGNSVEIVTKASARFDREKKQIYTLYIAAYDKGTPPMKNVTTLKVDVHDKNDNAPGSGGDLSLLVNSYQGKFLGGPIGKVYIKDDDRGTHDLYEHTLTSQSPGKYFSVGKSTGDIIAAPNVPEGKYKLAFRSRELNRKVGPNQGIEVVSTATVNVRAISEKQAKTSVAIRMQGLTKPGTCQEMPYPEFEKILAEILKVPVEMVTVFSAQPVKDMHRGVDVRFAVRKSPKPGYAGDDAEYMDKSTLVPILNSKIAEIEKKTGGKVAGVGIDACAKETCQVGFCYNDIMPKRTFQIITDDNGIVPANPASKTFISIDIDVVATCLTGPRKPKSCKDKPCFHGGKCKDLISGGFSCSCPKKEYNGPQCESTLKSFKTKQSYLWVKPLNYFFEGVLSFEFGTKEANGVILYQGPVHKISSTETKDFLSIELINGRIRVQVNQGDTYRNFAATVNTKNKLNDGVFHSIRIYKKGTYIRVTVDECRDAEIIESGSKTSQDRSSCEVTGIIGGKFRFVNGLNPLQLGGIKNKNLAYPPLTVKDSFSGCIRKVTDNGIVYDLSKTIEERDIGSQCPLFAKCPKCIFGECRVTMLPFVCVCMFGWTGDNCDRRVKSYHYKKDSYTQYRFIKGPGLSWQDRYHSLYEVQVQAKTNGIIVYETSSTAQGAPMEFSILEIVNKQLQYRYNVGDGTKVLIFRGFNASDNKWHNVTVDRRGNYAVMTVHGVGQVSGTVGQHQLLDSDGVIYAGGVPPGFKVRPPYDLQGCLADYRVRNTYMDSDTAVERKRVRVEPNGCPCVGIVCLNGGICVAGSPPYCICPPGYTGLDCGIPVVRPEAGAVGGVLSDGYLAIVICLVVFLLVLVLAALLLASKFAGKKTVPLYIDDPRDNVMPYHDEGAGEDDFHNYDLERLLKHAGANRTANGVAGGAGGAGGAGAGDKDIVHQPLLTREDVDFVAASGVEMRQKKARFEGASVESVDVGRFITSRLEEANSEDAAYPRDTLLHYGYEGEGSDVDDLSELGDSEDESDDDDADFGFLGDWGTKFDNLNKIFNPPTDEFDEDV